jgi:F1F0 ATPase subunit 2
MSVAVGLVLALGVGVALGVFYFGTLWLVVRRLPRAASPALWLGVTSALRLAVVLALVYALRPVLLAARWDWMVSALIGFVAIRMILTRRLG